MKFKVLTILMVLIFGASAIAQLPKNDKNGKVEYTNVVQLEGMSKDEIYKKAKIWMVSTLKSGDNMVELDGSTSDKIVGTGNIELHLDLEKDKTRKKLYLNKGFLNFKFLIFCKEGRLKYEVKNFRLIFDRTDYNYKNISTNMEDMENFKIPGFGKSLHILFKEYSVEAADRNIKALINDFLVNMKTDEEDDW